MVYYLLLCESPEWLADRFVCGHISRFIFLTVSKGTRLKSVSVTNCRMIQYIFGINSMCQIIKEI